MDLKDLQYFSVIAQCGSILAASEELHIAQPSLSIRIKALECELGVKLFDRRPRGVALTSEGEELLVHARQILLAAETARESVRLHSKTPVGTVNFGVPTSLASVVCVPLVEETLDNLPDVRLRIIESMSGYIVDWLKDGRLDIGLIFGDKPISGIHLEPIIEEDLYLAANCTEAFDGLLDEAGEVPLERLSLLPMILPTGHHGLRQLIDDMLRRHGISRGRCVEIDSFLQIQTLVQRKMGMTILSRAALHESPLNPPLASVRISSPPITRTICLACGETRANTKAMREIANRVRMILRERAPGPSWSARLLDSGDGV